MPNGKKDKITFDSLSVFLVFLGASKNKWGTKSQISNRYCADVASTLVSERRSRFLSKLHQSSLFQPLMRLFYDRMF